MLVLLGCFNKHSYSAGKGVVMTVPVLAAVFHAAAAANLFVIVSAAPPARRFPAVDLIKLSLFHKLS